MDGSSIIRYRGEVAVLLGFALLLNPFVVAAYDVGDPDWYRYEATDVTFDDDGTYEYETASLPLDSDVACFGERWSRACVLERAVHADGGVTYDGPPRSFMSHQYQYVHVWDEGFFRPTAEPRANDLVWYGLEAVSTEEALDDVATPVARASPAVRTAITDGAYETSDPIDGANELVRAEDGYYVVHLTAAHTEAGERTGSVVALQWLLGVTGAWLVLRGQRHRVERE